MTNEITPEIRAEAEEIGAAWGQQEVELWRDQHADLTMREWNFCTYAGHVPMPEGLEPESDEWSWQHDAVYSTIDHAAKAVWDAARGEQ